ncbi:MAG: hypothetical protein EPO20_12890 [Betaproteobacteria bacterium]|nr:MAG: hypothetical protein EPO20_12890 [Betaproteobacteria bacterium]
MGTLSLEKMPNSSPDKLFALRGHMVAGFAIFVLMLVRLAVRLSTRRPLPLGTGNAFIDRLAPAAHYGLYGLVLLMAASGLARSPKAFTPPTRPRAAFRGRGCAPCGRSPRSGPWRTGRAGCARSARASC